MPDFSDAYRDELIRSLLIIRGVPDNLDELPPRVQRIARELIDEFGPAAFEGLKGEVDKRIALEMARLLVQIDSHVGEGNLTADDAEAFSSAVRGELAEFSVRVGSFGREAVGEAIAISRSAHERGIAKAAALAGVSVTVRRFERFEERVTRKAALRRRVDEPVEVLVRANARLANGQVDRFIRQNVGKPYRAAGDKILQHMSANNPVVQNALGDLGQRGVAVRRHIVRAGRALEDLSDMTGRSLYSNAQRALRHEMRAMYHEATAFGGAESPIVGTFAWSTSARHDGLPTSPDECDILEDLDPHGLGPGVYFAETVPSLVHPYCEDEISPIFRDPSEWNTSKPKPTLPRELSKDEIVRVLERRSNENSPGMTKDRVNHILEVSNRVIQVAHDAHVDF